MNLQGHEWTLWTLPFLDRIAGSDLKIPFKKNLRRIGIPLILYLYEQHFAALVSMAILGIIFCFNLDEIEEKDYDDVFCYGASLWACLWYLTGFYGVIISIYWVLFVWLSNEGFPTKLNWKKGLFENRWKLDWKYVEFFRFVSFLVAFYLNKC